MQTRKPLKDDKELISRAQAGERRAFDQLMPPYIGAMRGKLRFMIKRRDDVEDVLQVALYRAWRYLPKFRGDCALSTWLYYVVHTCALNYFNARRPEGLSLDTSYVDGEPIDPPDLATPENTLEAMETCAQIAFRWAVLPEVLGQALFLYEIEQRSYAEIATIQSVPIGTVRSRIHRARALLLRT